MKGSFFILISNIIIDIVLVSISIIITSNGYVQVISIIPFSHYHELFGFLFLYDVFLSFDHYCSDFSNPKKLKTIAFFIVYVVLFVLTTYGKCQIIQDLFQLEHTFILTSVTFFFLFSLEILNSLLSSYVSKDNKNDDLLLPL